MRLSRYNKATEDALNEARLIMLGDLHPKKYKSAKEFLDEKDHALIGNYIWNIYIPIQGRK